MPTTRDSQPRFHGPRALAIPGLLALLVTLAGFGLASPVSAEPEFLRLLQSDPAHKMSEPYGLVLMADGQLVVGEMGSKAHVRVFDLKGKETASFGGDQTPLHNPAAVTLTDDGAMVIVDGENRRVFIAEKAELGFNHRSFGKKGTGKSDFGYPAGVAVRKSEVYVSDTDQGVIKVFDLKSFKLKKTIAVPKDPSRPDIPGRPGALTFGPKGRLYVIDKKSDTIRIYSRSGKFERKIGESLKEPIGLCVDRKGLIHVADRKAGHVVTLDRKGKTIKTFAKWGGAGGKGGSGGMWDYQALDKKGKKRSGQIKASNKDEVLAFIKKKGWLPLKAKPAGGGKADDSPRAFKKPTGIALDEKRKRLYVSDTGHGGVLVFKLD